jgi:hypothetical protein
VPPQLDEDDDRREQILRLEAEIEGLTRTREGCRKIMLASRTAIVIGAVLLLSIAAGLLTLAPVALLAALTAVIGGIVLLGSNKSTAEQVRAALEAAEARRAELIGRMRFRVVGGTDLNSPPSTQRWLH